MATHTPGPWELKRTSSRIEVRTDPMNCYAFSHQDEANARLIAAAPDLLALANSLIAAWGEGERSDDNLVMDMRCLVDQARAALVKTYILPADTTQKQLRQIEDGILIWRGDHWEMPRGTL